MPKYRFRVHDIKGKITEGVVEAATESIAADILNDKGYTILLLAEQRAVSVFNRSMSFVNRVKPKDLMFFARQFAVLISATVPIVQALRIMTKQIEHPVLHNAVSDIADRVNGGMRLSDALERYPKIFSDFFINMIRSGEMSGKLDDVLNYLANQLERDYELVSRIKGALIYPAVVLSGLVGVAIFMMVAVVPKLVDVITESGAALPLSTRILIGTSNFLIHFWWFIIIIIVVTFSLFRVYTASTVGKRQKDFILLYIPIFGKLFRKIYIVRFTRSLATLISGGVNITRALEITAATVGNEVYKELLMKTSREVENGNSISTVLIESPIVPSMVSQIMIVGEQTGRLDEVLEKITNFFTLEVDNTVQNLVSLLEPLIIVTMGGGVGILVASIILPIYQVATSF